MTPKGSFSFSFLLSFLCLIKLKENKSGAWLFVSFKLNKQKKREGKRNEKEQKVKGKRKREKRAFPYLFLLSLPFILVFLPFHRSFCDRFVVYFNLIRALFILLFIAIKLIGNKQRNHGHRWKGWGWHESCWS